MKKFFILWSFLVLIWNLVSCSNFMNGSDLKQSIEEQINYYKNSPNDIYVFPAEGTGTVVPSGTFSKRVGDTISLEFTPSDNVVFKRWQAIDKDTKRELTGVVDFSDPYSLVCKATVITSQANVHIRPFCLVKTENEKPIITDLQVFRGDDKNISLSKNDFNNWEDSDYNVNHVNSLNINITGVDKGSGIYSVKITENMCKNTSGIDMEGLSSSEITSNINYTGNDGEYSTSFKYEFVNTNDGLVRLEIQLCDNSGNYSDAITYYVIKDTQVPKVYVCNNGVVGGKSKFVLFFESYNGEYKYNPIERVFDEDSSALKPLYVEYCPGNNLNDEWFGSHKTRFSDLKISYKFHEKIVDVPESLFNKDITVTTRGVSPRTFDECVIELDGIDSSVDEKIEFYIKDYAGNTFTNYVTVPKADRIYNHEVDGSNVLKLFYRRATTAHVLMKKTSDSDDKYKQYIVSSDGLTDYYNKSVFRVFENKELDLKFVTYSTSGVNGYHNMVFSSASDIYHIDTSQELQQDPSMQLPEYTYQLFSDGLNSSYFTVRVTFSGNLNVYDRIYVSSSTSNSIVPLENGSYLDIPISVKGASNGVTYIITAIANNKKNTASFTINSNTPGFEDNDAPRLNWIYTDNLNEYNIGQILKLNTARNLGGSSLYDENGDCKLYYYIRSSKSEWTATFLSECEIPEDVYENIDKNFVLAKESRTTAASYPSNQQFPSFIIPIASLPDANYAIYVKMGDMAGNVLLQPLAYFFKSYEKRPSISVANNNITVKSQNSFNVVTYCYFENGEWKNGQKITGYSSTISKTFTTAISGAKFIKVRTLYTSGREQYELQDYDNRKYVISSPTYYYTGLGSGQCNKKVLLKGIGGFVVYCDNPVYIHTVYDKKDWGNDAEQWERFVLDEQKINPLQLDSSDAYTLNDSSIPNGYHYRVIAHFADGTSLISEDMTK